MSSEITSHKTARDMTRVAVIRDPSVQAGTGGFTAIQAIAPSFGVELTPVGVRDADEIEHGLTAFARGSNGGMITVGPHHRWRWSDLIIALAARHRLRAVYSLGFFVAAGDLISYGAGSVDQFWRAASYVDCILEGEKPADLPVRQPTKFELVINLKTVEPMFYGRR
jgi:putative tryptophan/tyrosine transport system substrate-binding protein